MISSAKAQAFRFLPGEAKVRITSGSGIFNVLKRHNEVTGCSYADRIIKLTSFIYRKSEG